MTKTSMVSLVSVAAFAVAGMVTAASAAQEPAAETVSASSAEAVSASPASSAAPADSPAHRALLDRYCVTCHNDQMVNGRGRAASPLVGQLRAVGLTLDTLDLAEVGSHADRWRRWSASCAAA